MASSQLITRTRSLDSARGEIKPAVVWATDPRASKRTRARWHFALAGFASAVIFVPGTALAQTDIGCTAANALFGAILGGGRQAIPCNAESKSPQSDPSAQGRTPADQLAPDQRAALGRVVPQARTHYESLDPQKAVDPRNEPCERLMRQEWQSGRMQSLLYVVDECKRQTEVARSAFLQRRTDAIQQQRNMAAEERAAELTREDAERKQRQDERFKAYAAQLAAQEEQDKAEARQLVQDLRSGKKVPAGCVEWLLAQGLNPAEMKAPVTRVALEPPRSPGVFWGEVLQLGAAKVLLFDGDTIARNMLGEHASKHLVVSISPTTKVFRAADIRQGGAVRGFGAQTGVQDVQMTDGSVQRSPAIAAMCLEPGGSYR